MKSLDTLAKEASAALCDIATQLERLNDNLESGRVNVREHSAMCVAPPNGDYTIQQLTEMSKFLHAAIKTGAPVLPPNTASNVEPAEAAVTR